MKVVYIIIIILIIILLITVFRTSMNETFGDGSLVQLYAKDDQDLYLTNDAQKYLPFNPVAPQFFWNNPTRNNDYPTYYYPYEYIYPFQYFWQF
jgi:hypothetical protein